MDQRLVIVTFKVKRCLDTGHYSWLTSTVKLQKVRKCRMAALSSLDSIAIQHLRAFPLGVERSYGQYVNFLGIHVNCIPPVLPMLTPIAIIQVVSDA